MEALVGEEEMAHLYSDAAVRVGFCKCVWMYCYLAGMGAFCFCVYLAIRMIVIWKIIMYTKAVSALHISVLVGVDVGVLTVVISLVFLVPRMIMLWITALVFEIFFERGIDRRGMIRDGKKIAGEISRSTFTNALNIAATLAGLASLLVLTLLRERVSGWTESVPSTSDGCFTTECY